MKKVIFLVGSLLVCLFVLAGCSCKHQWAEAKCETPKVCTLCEETEGEPLGHSWIDAACESPKTCSACAATEGQPLAHSEAGRYQAIDYPTCEALWQIYCSDCDQTLSDEEVILDALHDGSRFFFDSESYLERYTVVAENLQFESCDFTVIEEETTKDVLMLEYNGGRFGKTKIIGGEDYTIRVRFTFCDLVESGREDALPRCTRIVVSVLSATVGDPHSGIDIPEEEATKANNVMLLSMIYRNVCVTLMTCDPTLEAEFPRDVSADLLLSLLDSNEDGTILNNSAIHNNIRYSFNENGELVIEVAS